VETLHYVENPHVYGVFYFRAMRSFHDLWPGCRTGRTGGCFAAPACSREVNDWVGEDPAA